MSTNEILASILFGLVGIALGLAFILDRANDAGWVDGIEDNGRERCVWHNSADTLRDGSGGEERWR